MDGIVAVLETMSLQPSISQRALDPHDVQVLVIIIPDTTEVKSITDFLAAGGIESQLNQESCSDCSSASAASVLGCQCTSVTAGTYSAILLV